MILVARIKKIINADEDVAACSNNAAFAITVATESFIRYLADKTFTVVRSERRPRRNVAYRDVSTAIHKHDNLEFLVDVVPKTITYKQWKDKQDHLDKKEREKDTSTTAGGKNLNGQRTLKQMTEKMNSASKTIDLDGLPNDINMEDEAAAENLDTSMRSSDDMEEG